MRPNRKSRECLGLSPGRSVPLARDQVIVSRSGGETSRRRAAATVDSDDPVLCNLQPERDRLIGGQRQAGGHRPLEVGWGHGPARTIERFL